LDDVIEEISKQEKKGGELAVSGNRNESKLFICDLTFEGILMVCAFFILQGIVIGVIYSKKDVDNIDLIFM
jgi:hypothetical protein